MTWSTANCAERALSRRRKAFGALDLGTNNCRLMIAVPRRDRFTVVDTFSRIVRLGEGLSRTGRISEAAQDRAIEALKRCAEIVARWELSGLRCVTTEACRSAANGPEFVARVRRETGLVFDIIGPGEEARLAVLGCSGLLADDASAAAIFDIGGGSTEISFAEASRRRAQGDRNLDLRTFVSLPYGVVRLSDGLKPGGFAGQHYDGIRRRVAEAVGDVIDVDAFRSANGHLIGTSGTATSLAALFKGLKRYRRREIDGSWLTREQIEAMVTRLFELGLEGRRAEPCIGSGRADLIMPGCAILQGILDAAGCDRIRVADRGLREGLITELLATGRRGPVAEHRPNPQPAE